MPSLLFSEFKLRGLTLKNRVVASPMGMYAAEKGYVRPFHLVHLGAFAMGGCGLVFVEQTAVTRDARITNGDLGLWEDGHLNGMRDLVYVIKSQGAAAGIQINHAGRKANQQRAMRGGTQITDRDVANGEDVWRPWGPSAEPFAEGWQPPSEMSRGHMDGVRDSFVAACRRAVLAGFDVIELHMAHGYLLQSFLTPLANKRTDEFGGSRENRMRFPLEVAAAVRETIPDSMPLMVRISCVDWVEGGWTLDDSIEFSVRLKELGVDLVDCSSGGNLQKPGATNSTNSNLTRGPGYQVPFADRIRSAVDLPTGAVGYIRDARFAEEILQDGSADLIFIARQLLFNPYWTHHAAEILGETGTFERWPEQYGWWLDKWARALRETENSLFDSATMNRPETVDSA